MKCTFTLLFFILGIHVFAQWSDTTNLFTDSLHMQVTSAARNQDNVIILRSYPDGGYFVIWQDHRNDPTAYDDVAAIYAQKYSKTGKRLWAINGVPASSSTNNQHYTYQGQDYRNRSFAATDSAGGFYITYADDSVATYTYQRVCVQHFKSNGNIVFGGSGHIIYSSVSGNAGVCPQLIADGNGGFFISYIASVNGFNSSAPDNLFIYCFKETGGTLVSYGGGQVNENAAQVINSSPCGNYSTLNHFAADVADYNIFSDLQGGCNVVMYLGANGSQGKMLGYNKLFRAKQNATATEHYLGSDFSDSAITISYQAGNVYRLYYLKTDFQTISCGSGSNVYVVTQYRLVQNGFEQIDGGAALYDLADPKGVTVPTTGNINATILAAWKRSYSVSAGVSNPVIKAYAVNEEIYDSIPYQRTSNISPNYPGYNTTPPASMNKLNNFYDTILPATYNYDFSLSGGGNQIFASGVEASGGFVRLQHLAVEAQTADSFAVVYKTDSTQGTIIGQGSYGQPPLIAVNKNGNALFYIKQYNGSSGPVRVSPVLSGSKLAWGAMGETLGTSVWNGGYYDMASPVVSIDPANGTALIGWTDTRNNATTGYDIYIRHLDHLNASSYEPPYKRVRSMPNPYGPVTSAAVLYGTSKKLTTFDAYDSYGNDAGVSPAAAISDNYNLGSVNVSVYDNTGSVRSYNGKPYLDRSFVITPQNNPNGAATVTVRLFFTTAQFDALQAADTSIRTPGDLAVIKQPSGSGSGSTYTLVAGEQTVIPQSWAAVDGGYYIEIQVTSFSNFFIFKNNNVLAIRWLGIQAQWLNNVQATVRWQTADEQNVKTYTVQHSTDAVHFTDASTVSASNQTEYSSVVPAGSGSNYYRVVETDNDGAKAYSTVIQLQGVASSAILVYPNPAHSMLYVEGVQQYALLQVIDMQGNVVLQQKITAADQSLNISGLSSGNYLLKLVSKTQVQTLKFTKQ